MGPSHNLYTEEFKAFKYLQLSPEFGAYYKMVSNLVDGLKGESKIWPFRVQFVDQLLDLQGSTIYIVNTDHLAISRDFYEEATLNIIENAQMVEGNIAIPELGVVLNETRIRDIEHGYTDKKFLLFPGTNLENLRDSLYDISSLPVVPKMAIGYNAIFATKDVAEEYQFVITQTLRHRKAALSTINRFL